MSPSFLDGGGAMGALMRAHPWSASPLGPPALWPEALQNAVRTVLGSTAPVRVTWGRAARLLYNDAYAELLGDRHPAALGLPLREAWREEVSALDHARVAGGQTAQQTDFTISRTRAGRNEAVVLNFCWVPIRSGDDPVAGVLCLIREQSSAERDQYEREREVRRLRELFEQSPSFIAVLEGPEHVFRSANPSYLRLTGQRDLIGLSARTALPDIEGQGFFELLDEVYRSGVPHVGRAVPIELVQAAGEPPQTRFIDFTCQPLRSALGAVTGILVEGIDVTSAKRAHDIVKLSEAKFRTFAQAMPTLVWAAQPSGELDWFNDQALTYTGHDRAYLAGAGWTLVVHPEDLPRARESWMHAVSQGEPYQAEFRLRRHDGAYRWHLARALPIRDSEGVVTGWIGSNIDVEDERLAREHLEAINATLERRVEDRTRERASLEDQLRQAQKMDAVGQLTGGIAHDFNNMLAAILGSIELTKRRLAAGRVDEAPKLLEQAESSIRRAAALTQRLLAFARRQPLNVTRVAVAELLHSVQDMLARTLGPSIALQISAAGDLWAARSDAAQLESALLNLVINARDAMPDGGRLLVEAENGALDARYAALQADVAAGDYVVIRIADSGSGMPADVLAKAFDPFFTTKPVGQGSGLGLSMVFGFMKQVGGHIRLHSQVGHGTTVTLYLPRDASSDAAPKPSESAFAAIDATGEMILLVEDDDALRELQAEILAELGYRHIAVADGPAALRVLESGRGIDLMLTDVGLPGMNGRQLAELARKLRPRMPIVFLTGFAGQPATEKFLGAHMHLLTKPVEVEVLGDRLRKILARRTR